MDVKEAAQMARKYVADVFADDEISSVGLEEVEFDDGAAVWRITLSFLRPTGTMTDLDIIAGMPRAGRSRNVRRLYKTVNVDDESGRVISVKHRVLDAAE